ncbi:hypothetical protein KAW65_00125 [candidate division WOR-3 bacterium]|nr:hypothetical protein [candidate division WOR-3 bacterium]
MANPKNNKSESIDDLVTVGSDIAGGVAGASVGFFTAGPGGAVLGGISGPLLAHTFRRLAKEIKHRFLGKREEVRIGATIAFAAEKIQENIANGQQVRQDDFFREQLNERASAEEILEGVLLAAQREHQEKKLQFYGNLVANISFHPEIDRAQANLLIRLGEDISYRQMCLLALFAHKGKFGLRQEDYRGTGNIDATIGVLLQEIYNLYSRGMVNCSGEALLGLKDVRPAKMNVQGAGATLYNLMELWKVSAQELNRLTTLLR